ncbi:14471_t:CDS:2 [Funneliformis geosporum]|uniref:27_t:CDS:1 n=1 Tax=Funneliformis geosporum TaxID=1117311 RepID=A0A9W4SEP3_9GLOM|nr:27_t:CDS:2 [Funneliformis geosporum]CAI2167305.1 14471_t:CDS:2 [Funneliformis geosporum]
MLITLPATILEHDIPSFNVKEQGKVTYKLIKLYTFDNNGENNSAYAYDSNDKTDKNKSHTQLFYNLTDKKKLSKCTPSYFREVFRPDERFHNLHWYTEALKSVSSSSEPTKLWTIDQVKIKKSKFSKQIRRPRLFSISNTELGNSVFKYDSSKNESKGYSGYIATPCDNSCIQRYRWVRYKDGSGWAFIARNDPNTILVEFLKTDFDHEFDIIFLKNSPPGWRISKDSTNFDKPAQFMGRYPSIFSNPSTIRSSTTSGLLSNVSIRESTFSDISTALSVNDESVGNGNGGKISNVNSLYSERNFTSLGNLTKFDPEKSWQEYVLASTVAIQDEVNQNKRRLWKK